MWHFYIIFVSFTYIFSVKVLLEILAFSYCGAQIFEIYGLGKDVVDIAFCGSVSSIGGLTLDEVINPIGVKNFHVFCLAFYVKKLFLHFLNVIMEFEMTWIETCNLRSERQGLL